MELNKAIETRHSCRSFKSKAPDYRDVIEAVDAALKVPLAGNLPTLKFVLVSDKEKIKQLSEAANQPFIAKAPYVVVVYSNTKQCKRCYEKRADMYCRQQAGAAIENFLLKITELKLASCWVGAFSEQMVKKAIEVPVDDNDIQIEAILPIGYEYQRGRQKKKPNPDTCIFFNTYKNKYMKPLTTRFEAHYEAH